jgi:hypothetical protein
MQLYYGKWISTKVCIYIAILCFWVTATEGATHICTCIHVWKMCVTPAVLWNLPAPASTRRLQVLKVCALSVFVSVQQQKSCIEFCGVGLYTIYECKNMYVCIYTCACHRGFCSQHLHQLLGGQVQCRLRYVSRVSAVWATGVDHQ